MAKDIEKSLCTVFSYQEYFNRKGRKWFTIDMKPPFFSEKNSLKCFFSFQRGHACILSPGIMALCPSDGALGEAGSEYRQRVTRQRSQTPVSGSWVFLCSITYLFSKILSPFCFGNESCSYWTSDTLCKPNFLMPFCLSPFSLFTV